MRSLSQPAIMVPTKFMPPMIATVQEAAPVLMPMSRAWGIMWLPMSPLDVPPQMA